MARLLCPTGAVAACAGPCRIGRFTLLAGLWPFGGGVRGAGPGALVLGKLETTCEAKGFHLRHRKSRFVHKGQKGDPPAVPAAAIRLPCSASAVLYINSQGCGRCLSRAICRCELVLSYCTICSPRYTYFPCFITVNALK